MAGFGAAIADEFDDRFDGHIRDPRAHADGDFAGAVRAGHVGDDDFIGPLEGFEAGGQALAFVARVDERADHGKLIWRIVGFGIASFDDFARPIMGPAARQIKTDLLDGRICEWWWVGSRCEPTVPRKA